MESQYNLRSPAVKRLMREAQELAEPTEQYFAQPIEENLFEWHFTIRGPTDSDFDGGVYHGRIILPPDYPMKPPSIMFLTPNGRFDCATKICLSISKHHPESWQPSWSIRTALLAMIGFMPTPGHGAIGSLDYTPQERKMLAKKSTNFVCSQCGAVKDKVLPQTTATSDDQTQEEIKSYAAQLSMQGEKKKAQALASNTPSEPDPSQPDPRQSDPSQSNESPVDESLDRNNSDAARPPVDGNVTNSTSTTSQSSEGTTTVRQRRAGQSDSSSHVPSQSSHSSSAQTSHSNRRRTLFDQFTYSLMVLIAVVIGLLLLRRLINARFLSTFLNDE